MGAVQISGVDLVLRPARLGDGPAWRRARLDDEQRLRPTLGDPGRSWDQDSSLTAWAEHVLRQRRAVRAGTLTAHLALTGRGEVLGELSFLLEARSGAGECSLWTTRSMPSAATLWAAATTTLGVLDGPTHVPWMVAPVAVGNPAPSRLLTALGYEPAGTSRQLRRYAGRPTDHVVWRLENSAGVRHDLREIVTARAA
jgi:hypothetical protein